MQSPPRISRRSVVSAASLALLHACATPARRPSAIEEFQEIRSRIGGRLGIYALDTGSGRSIGMDEDSRYAMASTFKLMLAASVLERVDGGTLSLAQPVTFEQSDIVTYSPVASQQLQQGQLSIETLCSAIVEVSDNTAANLLLRLTGGPSAFTQFMRAIGDRATRLDRIELELNTNLPGDARDTTTARAMVSSMQTVLMGNVLSETSRSLLTGWMIRSTTGLRRIRAGLPPEWQAGDKTGTGQNGAVNDVAILWPPARRPILAAVYMSESTLGTEALNAAHGQIGRAISAQFA